jgi:hypothetical protein
MLRQSLQVEGNILSSYFLCCLIIVMAETRRIIDPERHGWSPLRVFTFGQSSIWCPTQCFNTTEQHQAAAQASNNGAGIYFSNYQMLNAVTWVTKKEKPISQAHHATVIALDSS